MLAQAENFHGKEWFEANDSVHGHDGLLDVEPHDMVSCACNTRSHYTMY